MNIQDIAKIAHEANKAYCQTIGDYSQQSWEDSPEWQQQSAIAGVKYHLANPTSTPADSHVSWLEVKKADGWKYGPVKDPEKKEHPCYVTYEELPESQKIKDYVFTGIVKAVAKFVEKSSI